ESGRLGVDERHIPDRVPLAFDFWGWLHLAPGFYMIQLNEAVRLPLDIMALGRPRSTILRCGAALHTAVWDPGYAGKSECLLTVHNPAGIELQKDARVMQLVFFRLEQPAETGYAGRYQGENL
ncbi:MAG TPA: deoxyuridine 5'-triphosphate nucleotidohydrolase, partial [Chloroflexota bacterium]|nr:deoxyuridine 5'-triphosphate nucleotidohydrolase [Chloroflexota bacterium]